MHYLSVLMTFAVTVALTRHFVNPASRFHMLDLPNERSLHTQPIPRSGGVALCMGLCAGVLMMGVQGLLGGASGWLALAALPVAVVSFLDDRFNVHQGVRIAVHLLAAAGLLQAGYRVETLELPGLSWSPPPAVMMPVLVIAVVWMTNLYNFMDGMDGLAGVMAVIGFSTFALLGSWQGHPLFSGMSLLVVAAATGFLLFNLPPARIFLGDTGSSTLGFFAAAFSLWGARDGLFPLWLAGLIFSPFIVDATVTLGRRLMRGERIWLPHKTHYYQRLVQIGWGHRGTLLAESCLMLLCSLSALLAVRMSSTAQFSLLAAWVLGYAGLLVGVGCLERRLAKAETS